MTILTAACTTRSVTVGISNGRFSALPGFSIHTRLTDLVINGFHGSVVLGFPPSGVVRLDDARLSAACCTTAVYVAVTEPVCCWVPKPFD